MLLHVECCDVMQACSFLLSSADVVSYAKVYDACLRLLSAGMSYEPSADGSKSFVRNHCSVAVIPVTCIICVHTDRIHCLLLLCVVCCMIQELCCVHYHVLVCWHLLSSLPPSVQYLRNLGDLALPLSDISILNNLRWRDRLATRTFHLWVKVSDILCVAYLCYKKLKCTQNQLF